MLQFLNKLFHHPSPGGKHWYEVACEREAANSRIAQQPRQLTPSCP